MRWCRLTSWKDREGVPWLQIPYYSREGRLVGVQNRNLSLPQLGEVGGGCRVGGGPSPRFRFPAGSPADQALDASGSPLAGKALAAAKLALKLSNPQEYTTCFS